MDEMQFYQSPESVVYVGGQKVPVLGSILLEGGVFSRDVVGALDVRNTGPYAV